MALGLYTTFTLDMVPGGAPPIIHVSAGDVGRLYTANLTYNGKTYDIQGTSVTIRGTKPDKTVFEYPVDDFEQNESWVDFLIEEQMAIVPGQVICELREYLNDDQIGSANFVMIVEESPFIIGAPSTSDITGIGTSSLEDGAVTTAKLADDSVTSAKIDDSAVTTAKLSTELQTVVDDVDTLRSELESGEETDAGLHLGFYLDENGDLCQVEEG